MVSTRLRWRVFRPWIEKPCSRVLRKLSGELTTIQYCAVRPPPPREVLQRLLERPRQLLVLAGIDGRPDVGGRLPVEVRVSQEPVDARRRVDEVGDQAAQGGEGGAMPVAQAGLVEPVDEVAGPLGDRAQEQHDVRGGHLFLKFHSISSLSPSPRPSPEGEWQK